MKQAEAPSSPLVIIEWEDSAQPVPGWAYLDDWEWSSAVRCSSVGWLVHDGDDVKALALNRGVNGDGGQTQVSGVIRIPARCVTRIAELSE